jgi:hypothetical protein
MPARGIIGTHREPHYPDGGTPLPQVLDRGRNDRLVAEVAGSGMREDAYGE